MVGDWVAYRSPVDGEFTPVKVENIYGQEFNCKVDGFEIISGRSISDAYPLGLTKDILLKNGLRENSFGSVEGQNFEEDENLILELTVDKDGSVWWTISWNEYSVVALPYVHSLQHALRLCGIKKEIMI